MLILHEALIQSRNLNPEALLHDLCQVAARAAAQSHVIFICVSACLLAATNHLLFDTHA